MKPIIVMTLLFVGGCYHSKVDADRSTLAKAGSLELACGSEKAQVVFYGLRDSGNVADSPCFGDKAEAVGVVECAGKRKAYWRGKGGAWEARPGDVTSATADSFEITLGSAENSSGSVAAVARCTR